METKGVLRKAEKPYDGKLIGIISTNPGVLMGSIDGEGKEDKRMLALAGRVPVKIDPDSEPIEIGDFLTSSDKPGLAKKATKAGYTVGKALENWGCTTSEESKATSEVTGTGSSDGGTCQDRIETFVSLGYYMGDLTEDGFLDKKEASVSGGLFRAGPDVPTPDTRSDNVSSYEDFVKWFEMWRKAGGTIPSPFEPKRVSSVLPPSGIHLPSTKTIMAYVSQYVKENWDSLSRQNTDLIGSLWVKTGILSADMIEVAGVPLDEYIRRVLIPAGWNPATWQGSTLSVDVISPIASDSAGIAVELGPTQTFGIYNKEGSPAATFDSVGNASFSGTLYADRIVTRFGDLDARLAELIEATRSSVIASDSAAISSGIASSMTPRNDTGDTVLDATSSALLALLLNSPVAPSYFKRGSGGVTESDGEVLIDGTILIDKTGISTITDTLYLQPAKLGNLDIMGGTIVVNTAGDVVINGNLAVTGNLSIGGILGINVIRPINGFADLVFDATGSARFAGNVIASGSGIFRDLTVSASASGTFAVSAGEREITVTDLSTSGVKDVPTPDVNANYMISVTPTWETTVWVATKAADFFTLRFGTPPVSSASADWLMVRRQ